MASLALGVLSTLWGSSMMTMGLVSRIKPMAVSPFSLSWAWLMMFSAFLKASMLMIITSMLALAANWRTSDSLAEL